MTTLKFGLEEFDPVKPTIDDDYEQVKADRFQKVKIKLFGDGDNAHTEDVDMETLKVSADSAYDIPLIAELNPYRENEDFGGHGVLTGSEFSFGFIKESNDNPIKFEKDERTGKTFITLYGLIWKKYFENIIDIIKRNRDEVEVSVELDIVKGKTSKRGKPIMKQFVLNAVTFLGKMTTAACQGAKAELCFSANDEKDFKTDKENYIAKYFSEDIKIVNTKEEAVDGKWSNPRQKLLNPILKASNKISLLNEAYLFWDEGENGEVTLSDVSYPHHIVKDGKLVLHIRGVQAAFSRLAQQGEVKGKAKAHLLRHYKELGLNTENFEEFGLTKEQFELYFAEEYRKEEADLVSEKENETKETCVEESCDEKQNSYIEESDCSKEAEFELQKDEQSSGDEKTDKDDDSEAEKAEDKEEDKEEDDKEDMSSDNGIPPEKPLETADEVTIDELKERLLKLEADNEAYLAKIKEMADYEELKEFKEKVLIKEAQEAEMAKMCDVFKTMEDKGVSISEDTKKELLDNRANFANIDAWSNYVKAYAFDNCEKTEDGIIKFDMPTHKKQDNSALGVWANL